MCSPPEDTTPDVATLPLTNAELHMLSTAPGIIYTSTDGSVKKAQTPEASSTWALSIRVSPTTTISRRGKIRLSPGEDSSYRVELEGLVQLYTILPADTSTRHACDNEAAVKAHKSIHYHARKSARKWAKTEYRTTLDRLHQAMQNRDGDTIDVIHTHSHLEHTPTQDADLHTRRQILAEADHQADLAHNLRPNTCPTSNRERYTFHSAHGPLEKNIGPSTLTTVQDAKRLALSSLKMEGALSRHAASAVHTSKRCSLPDYLAIHRTKIILNRLPTRQERNRRHDTHANGEKIVPYCPHCPQQIETHAHALVTCPHNNSNVNSF
jgi:hypothetical protein